MQTIRVPVRGDNQYVECIVSPPAVPVPISFSTTTATGPDNAEEFLPPPPPPFPEQVAEEPERVGGLLPEEWAALFRERQDILNPVLPLMEQQLSHIHVLRWWQINWLKSIILAFLCQVGLDRDALVQHLEGILGPTTGQFVDITTEAIVSQCGQVARRLLGLEDPSASQEHEDGPEDPSAAQEHEDGPAAPSGPAASPQETTAPSTTPSDSSAGPDTEELPSTSSGALARTPGQPGPRAASPSEQGRSRGSSARGRGRKRSAGGPRRPAKRRASSTQRAPLPCKKRPPRRL